MAVPYLTNTLPSDVGSDMTSQQLIVSSVVAQEIPQLDFAEFVSDVPFVSVGGQNC